MAKVLDSKIPAGPVPEKWKEYKAHQRLVNPKNKLKLDVIVVGTGLAGASAAASLGEMGKGGDYRAREANVYRLAEVSNNIIDQCVAQGVPFAREYGGMLANRSFGGAQVSRTFYAKGQTGQQLLLGAYSSLSCQVKAGKVKLYTRYEMEDVVIVDGRARGIIAKNLVTGKLERFSANAVVIATGGYGNTYFLSTNAMGCNCTAAVQCYRKGAYFANPSWFLRSLRTLRLCRLVPSRVGRFLRRIATTIWSAVILPSVTSYLVMLPAVPPRSVATRAMV